MSELFEKSIRTLELPRVLDLLSGCAVTEEGRARARELRPMDDMDDVKRAQAETTAARQSRRRSSACWTRPTPPEP